MTQKTQVRTLLFDRLVDHDPRLVREARPRRTLSRRDLRKSVRRELERLLNTRVQLPLSELEDRERTVIDYGIPDFGSFSAKSEGDRRRLAAALARTIETYEPRLTRVRFELDQPGVDAGVLRGRLSAMLVVESVREPVSFSTVIHEAGGEVE